MVGWGSTPQSSSRHAGRARRRGSLRRFDRAGCDAGPSRIWQPTSPVDRSHLGGRHFEPHGALAIGAMDLRPRFGEPRERAGVGMAEAIAPSARDDRDAWREATKERGAARAAGAVMGDL